MEKKFPLWKPVTKDLPRHHFLGQERQIANDIVQRTYANATTDTSSPLVAQDLAPDVIAVFVQKFPIFDMIRKVPANGLSHTFLQQTALSNQTDPHTIAETGTVSDDVNTYLRKTTNIAVFGERRGVSLKAQFAGNAAGGPSADLMGREVSSGLLTLARDVQNELLRYQESDSTSTTTTAANGKYDANGFNGLRYIVNNYSPPENSIAVDITSPWTDQRVLKNVRKMVNAIWDKGGSVDLLVTSTTGSEAMFEDQFSLVRYVKDNLTEITPGLTVRAIDTDQGPIPVLVVPGNSIGTYTATHTYTDIFAINTEELLLPYLGSPEPSVIRIPTAINGNLVELAIPFCMYGLAALAPEFIGRVQLETAA